MENKHFTIKAVFWQSNEKAFMKILSTLLIPLFIFALSSITNAEDKAVLETDKTKRVLIEENNLQALSVEMKEKKLGLVVMFHAEDCGYCKRLESEQLQPALRSGEYDGTALFRKILIDSTDDITNFDGKTISSDQLASTYEASMTPTLVFLDADGEERVERILGYNSSDFFGFYLDKAIDKLHAAVSKP